MNQDFYSSLRWKTKEEDKIKSIMNERTYNKVKSVKCLLECQFSHERWDMMAMCVLISPHKSDGINMKTKDTNKAIRKLYVRQENGPKKISCWVLQESAEDSILVNRSYKVLLIIHLVPLQKFASFGGLSNKASLKTNSFILNIRDCLICTFNSFIHQHRQYPILLWKSSRNIMREGLVDYIQSLD